MDEMDTAAVEEQIKRRQEKQSDLQMLAGVSDAIGNTKSFGEFLIGANSPRNNAGGDALRGMMAQGNQSADALRDKLEKFKQRRADSALMGQKLDYEQQQKMSDREFQRSLQNQKQGFEANQSANERSLREKLATFKAANSPVRLSEAQKTYERKRAADVSEWKENRDYILSDIEKLKDVEAKLADGSNLTGSIKGRLPWQDTFNPDGAQVKDKVASVTQKNLRKILGGQFAQKEGEQILQRGYDPTLDEKMNLERVRDLRMAMEAAAKSRDSELEQLMSGGSFLSAAPSAPAQSGVAASGASDKDSAAVKWAMGNMNDPRAMAILKANGVDPRKAMAR